MKKPTYDSTADEGIFVVGRIFNRDFGWAYRPQPFADFGIDAHVEICEEGEPTGEIIFLQIKSGTSYFQESTEGGYVFRGSERHCKYWMRLPVPVLLVMYNPFSEIVYWQLISSRTVFPTNTGFKTLISFNSKLDIKQKSELLKTVGSEGTLSDDSAITLGSGVDASEKLLAMNQSSHRTLKGKELKELGSKFSQSRKAKMSEATERLWNGAVLLSQWEEEVVQTIKTTFVCQFILAMGGVGTVNSVNIKRVSSMLRQQFRSLRTLSCDIRDGRYLVGELQEVIERSELFIDCSVLAFEMGQAIHGDVEYYRQEDGNWKVNIPSRSN